MKILHYSLGLPPYRTGGLTKYSIDLIEEQIKQGNEVILLWPGKISSVNKHTKIKKKRKKNNIINYEIVNPLPISLLDGINNYYEYTKELTNKKVYKQFLNEIKPEIIHVHTLMGLHKEFFEDVHQMGIPIIFTTHDYFGLCPKVNLLYGNKVCTDNQNFYKCIKCNENALSMTKIRILQSPVYRIMKDSKIIKKLRAYRNKVREEMIYIKDDDNNNNCNYKELFKYYEEIFRYINCFHFNSSLTKEIYNQKINISTEQKIVNIMHKDIIDNRQKKIFSGKLKISYLGNTKQYKGFRLLVEALDEIDSNKFEFNVYGDTHIKRKYIRNHSQYNYNDLKEIFHNTDLLIIPSIWYETFGFIALEGKSFGVPTIVTNYVGAKDIFINGYNGFIINPEVKDLKKTINSCIENRGMLSFINTNIINEKVEYSFKKHVNEISILYKEMLFKV